MVLAVVECDVEEAAGFEVLDLVASAVVGVVEVLASRAVFEKLTVGTDRAGMVVVVELELVSENASASVSTAASSPPPSSQPPNAATAVPARMTARSTSSTPPRPRPLSP